MFNATHRQHSHKIPGRIHPHEAHRIKRKKLTLTANGEVLYHYCSQIYNQAMAAQRFVDLMTSDSITVGVKPYIRIGHCPHGSCNVQ